MADQNITALPVTTAPETSDQLMIVGATEEKLIDYEKLADAILTKLTSKTFALNQGTMTLLQALNELNSKASRTTFNGNISRITFRSGSVGINNAYLDFWTSDGKRTTIGFFTDGLNGIQLLKDDTVVWGINIDNSLKYERTYGTSLSVQNVRTATHGLILIGYNIIPFYISGSSSIGYSIATPQLPDGVSVSNNGSTITITTKTSQVITCMYPYMK